MPNTLVLVKHGPEADRILDAFADRTGLPSRDGETARIFSLAGAGHEVDQRVPTLESLWTLVRVAEAARVEESPPT